MTLVEQAWQKWAASALSPGAPIQQRAAMKTAWFCSAASTLGEVLRAGEDQSAVVAAMCEELTQFLGMLEASQVERKN